MTGGLAALGLELGAHLVAALSNRLEMASLYWACQMMGVIFTPLIGRRPARIAYVIEDAEAVVVVYEARSEGFSPSKKPASRRTGSFVSMARVTDFPFRICEATPSIKGQRRIMMGTSA